MLTMGTPMTAPFSSSTSMSSSTRRATSMPFNSSPCTAAVRHNTGPGPLPLSTNTGTGTTKPSIALPLVQVSFLRVPGATSLPSRRMRPFGFSASPPPVSRRRAASAALLACTGGVPHELAARCTQIARRSSAVPAQVSLRDFHELQREAIALADRGVARRGPHRRRRTPAASAQTPFS